jgi:hypothetical protein
MVSQTTIKALNSVQAQLVKIPGLTEDQLEQIQAIITKNTQPKIKGTGKKTGYILFSVEERKRLKDAGELDGLAFGEVAKLIGKNWREAEQSLRDDWNSQAKQVNDANAKPQQVQPVQPVQIVSIEENRAYWNQQAENLLESSSDMSDEKPKKRRGRKPKVKSSDESNSEGEIKQQKRRGRKPKKQREEMVSEESDF